MTRVARIPIYRCSVCGTSYPPQEAVRRGYRCHGRPLNRVEPVAPRFAPLRRIEETGSPAALFRSNERPGLVEILPPARNAVDAGAVETLLGSLALGVPFSLEIAGDARGRRFLLRADPAALPALVAQIEGVYGRVGIEAVPVEEDPARRIGDEAVAQATLHLRHVEALPLSTFRDGGFRDADPILAVLGALGRLEEDERALCQLILSPAPPDWADRFVPLSRPPEQRWRTASPLGLGGGLLLAGGIGLGVIAALRTLTWLLTGRWLPALALAVVVTPPAYFLGTVVARRLNVGREVDPELVRAKIFQPAFFFRLRLTAWASDRDRAERLLRRLVAVYRRFGTGAGNGLVPRRAAFDPFLPEEGEEEGVVVAGLRIPGLPPPRRDILSAAEAATLWHLPVGDTAQLVRKVLDPRRLPRPEDVAEGVRIGTSVHQGREIPVHLPSSAARRNKLLLARTQRGKSTLMLHLARHAMEDPNRAVVFVDPHGDAVRTLLGVVPPHRVDDVLYVDFGDPGYVTGWNLLDVGQNFEDDVIVDAFVMAGRQMWADFWGPRMEDVMRAVVRTLLAANHRIVADPDLGPEHQFTVLDIAPMLTVQEFQQTLRVYIQDYPDLMMWWYGYFDQSLHHSQRLEVINPVMSKVNRLHSALSVRRAIGLSRGGLDLWEVVRGHRILLVNLPGGTIGVDNAAFLGSFLLSYLETVVRSHQELPREERPRVSFFVDECASVPYSYQRLLAELVKMGADFTLVAQSLHQLDGVEAGLAETVLANVDTLAVFQVAGADAARLVVELGNEVDEADLVNLPERTCVVKTQKDGRPLPVMTVRIAPPPTASEPVRQAILRRRKGYTITAMEADRRYEEHVMRYYRRPLEAFLEQMRTWARLEERRREEEEVQAYSEWLQSRRVPDRAARPMRVAGALQPVEPPRRRRGKRGRGGEKR